MKDYTNEYNEQIRPEINKRYKRVIITFIACAIILVISTGILRYSGLPEKLIFLIAIPCGGFYLREIYSFKEIKCPNCNKSLFNQFSIGLLPIYVSSTCPHCGIRIKK